MIGSLASGVAGPDGPHGRDASTAALEVERLTVSLSNGATVIDGLDFRVDAGETLALVGESGCGKSMTALAIMGLLPQGIRITSGQVRLEGRNISAMPEAQLRDLRGNAISMIFQEPMTSLNPVLTIGTQIEEVLVRHQRLTGRQARERAVELLNQVRLPQARQHLLAYPHQLSGGQRQRVMIAAALACRTRLLIADEPTTALDVTMQASILRLLRQLQKSHGLALLLITHDFSVVAQMADRVLVMYAGHKVENGPTRSVLAAPRHPYTSLLLQARPHGDFPRDQRLAEIPGMVSPPGERGAGCVFAPRCPRVMAQCRPRMPELVHAGPRHQAACVLVHE